MQYFFACPDFSSAKKSLEKNSVLDTLLLVPMLTQQCLDLIKDLVHNALWDFEGDSKWNQSGEERGCRNCSKSSHSVKRGGRGGGGRGAKYS